MMDDRCGTVREMIPDFATKRLDATGVATLERHCAECAECRAELELVLVLRLGRPAAPVGLSARVIAATRADRRPTARPWWGISAAAVAALMLGIGITSQPAGEADVNVPDYAYEVEDGELWVSDDGLLAGAPSLDLLSDEALEQLLEELVVGSSGGAA
jgi:hypothetical protein